MHNLAKTCFVVEEHEDREDLKVDENEGAIDMPDLEDDDEEGDKILPLEDISKLKEMEEEMLAKIPFPGAPPQEAERRKQWMKSLVLLKRVSRRSLRSAAPPS